MKRSRRSEPTSLPSGGTGPFSPANDTPPPVFTDAADKAWVKTPVDAFILAGLRKNGLKPAPQADRATLIRRVTYDLTGLPPTPEEIDAFVRDKSPNAWEKVVDRLLASPHYGEQWGRHWLDVVRFAESDGYEYDTHRPDAYRYRDYVVQSFNDDKPYDEFVKEQLAGDEMDPDEPDLPGRQRLQPPRPAAQERRQPGRRQFAERSAHRDDQHRRRGVPRCHRRLRALPRPQVRSVPPVRLLPPAGPLRADSAQRHRAGQQRRAGRLEGQGRPRCSRRCAACKCSCAARPMPRRPSSKLQLEELDEQDAGAALLHLQPSRTIPQKPLADPASCSTAII